MNAKKNLLKLGLPKEACRKPPSAFSRRLVTIFLFVRSYYPVVDDEEISSMLIRAQEMGRYVADGHLDCGLTGYDWMMDQNADVVEVAELQYGKEGFRPVRWVVAVPNDSKFKKLEDLEGKRIATRTGRLYQALFQEAQGECDCRFFVGSHRGEAAGIV